MFGLILIYVGLVLINNGLAGVIGFDKKATAVLNLICGCIIFFFNVVSAVLLVTSGAQSTLFFGPAVGFLFAITYFFLFANTVFSLDVRPFGYFCLFVCINALIAAYLDKANLYALLIWIAWAFFWFLGFVECSLNKSLGKFSSYVAIAEGIFTGWLPGLLILLGLWSW